MNETKLAEVKTLFDDKYNSFDLLDKVVNEFKLSLNAKILDIGTGRGYMAIILALNGFNVITGEPEGDNFADWCSNVEKVNLKNLINFKPFNAEIIPFEDSYFDAIFLYTSFHHINQKRRALEECVRIIKSDGKICIIEFNQKGVELVRKVYANHPGPVDPSNFMEGLQIIIEKQENPYVDIFILHKI